MISFLNIQEYYFYTDTILSEYLEHFHGELKRWHTLKKQF